MQAPLGVRNRSGVQSLRIPRDRRAPGARPFLLIARTGRIVTAHATRSREGATGTSTAGCSGFPANSQLHIAASLQRGAVVPARWDGFLP